MSSPVLSVCLEAGYGKQTLLRDLRFDLFPGDRMGLLGPSGSGKSTLLLALMGLLPLRGGWARGEVRLCGENLLTLSPKRSRLLRGKTLALVPQSPMTALNPALSLHAHFREAWRAHEPAAPGRFHQRVEELLSSMQLPLDPSFLRRTSGQISVGQAQRCTLALALLHRPAVLIADEPTASLDAVTQTEVIGLLKGVCTASQTALLFVSHDLMSVLRLCLSIAVLAEGRIGEHLSTEDIVTAKHPQLQALLQALPVPPALLLGHLQSGSHVTQVPQNGPLLAHRS